VIGGGDARMVERNDDLTGHQGGRGREVVRQVVMQLGQALLVALALAILVVVVIAMMHGDDLGA
jgi:hypothetical protein